MTALSYRCAVVGPGRMGTALVAALSHAGWQVSGPLGRSADPADAEIVLLAVPDGEIAAAAAALTPRPSLIVGHCSGATTLAPLAPHTAFSLHPLMTVTGAETTFTGAAAALSADDAAARAAGAAIADALGMRTFDVADEDRAAYHAGASIASNFLITLLAMAEEVSGIDRGDLAPLVRASVENWQHLGADRALTGPVARGDHATVERQRTAVAARTPQLLPAFDALVRQTEALAAQRSEVAA